MDEIKNLSNQYLDGLFTYREYAQKVAMLLIEWDEKNVAAFAQSMVVVRSGDDS